MKLNKYFATLFRLVNNKAKKANNRKLINVEIIVIELKNENYLTICLIRSISCENSKDEEKGKKKMKRIILKENIFCDKSLLEYRKQMNNLKVKKCFILISSDDGEITEETKDEEMEKGENSKGVKRKAKGKKYK